MLTVNMDMIYQNQYLREDLGLNGLKIHPVFTENIIKNTTKLVK